MTEKLPVLNYHGIETGGKPYTVLRVQFEAQLDHVKASGFQTLGLAGMEEWLSGTGNEKSVVLTFDDGLESHYQIARECLTARKMKGLFFIPAALVGTPGHITWDELKAMVQEGFEIGSHGLRHIPLTKLSDKELDREIAGSKKILEDRLGAEIKSFSVPRGYYQPRLGKLASEKGYRFVFTSEFDVNAKGQDPLALKRLALLGSHNVEQFSKLLAGDLGGRRYQEKVKGWARGFVNPTLYDQLAKLKNRAAVKP